MGSQRVGHDWATELNWARRPPNSRWILSFLLFSRPVFGPLVKFPGVAAKPCKVTKASRSRERDRPRRSKEEVARVIITPSWFHTALSDVLKHSHGWYHVLLVRWARKVLLAPLHREGSWAQDLHAKSRQRCLTLCDSTGFPAGTMLKSLPANAGDVRDMGSTPGSRRFPGGGHSYPLQYSCLENPMDRGAQGLVLDKLKRFPSKEKKTNTVRSPWNIDVFNWLIISLMLVFFYMNHKSGLLRQYSKFEVGGL